MFLSTIMLANILQIARTKPTEATNEFTNEGFVITGNTKEAINNKPKFPSISEILLSCLVFNRSFIFQT